MNFETNENHRQFLFTLIWFLSVWSSDESNEEKKSVKLPCALLCCGFGCKSTVTQHQPNRRFFYYFGNCMIPYLQIVLSTFILLTVARCVYSIFRFFFSFPFTKFFSVFSFVVVILATLCHTLKLLLTICSTFSSSRICSSANEISTFKNWFSSLISSYSFCKLSCSLKSFRSCCWLLLVFVVGFCCFSMNVNSEEEK